MSTSVARNALIYTLAGILVRASGLITLPIVSRYLSAVDYGNVAFASLFATLAATILGFGHETTVTRFYLQTRDPLERSRVASTWFLFSVWGSALIIAAIGSLYYLASATIALPLPERIPLVMLALATVPGQAAISLCGAVLRAEQRALPFAVLSVSTAFLSIAPSLLLVVCGWGPEGVLAGHATGLVLSIPFALKLANFSHWGRPDVGLLRPMLTFGWPVALTSLAYFVTLVADRFMLAWLGQPDALGMFAVAVALTSSLTVLIQAFGQAWLPDAIERAAKEGAEGAAYSISAATDQLFVLGFFAALLAAFSRPIVSVFLGPDFREAWILVPPLAFATYIYGLTNIARFGIQMSKRTVASIWTAGIGCGVNVSAGLLLIPRYGAMGAALAMIVSTVALVSAAFVLSGRLWPTSYFHRSLLGPTVATAIACVAALYTPVALHQSMMWGAAICLAYLAYDWSFGHAYAVSSG